METSKLHSTPLDYQKLYRECYASIEKHILTRGGNREDARDVFQEGLVVLWKKEESGLHLTASEKTLLFAICRNLWLKKVRQETRFVSLEHLGHTETAFDDEEVLDKEGTLKSRVKGLLQRLTAHCHRMIHDLFYRGKDIREIQLEYGYSSRQNAINQKYKCMNQLKKASNTKKTTSIG